MKKRILCFGDSNTYGSNPSGGRYDENTRWPMHLAQLLGDEYTVIEEGFGGRTICFDDPVEGGFKSGAAYFPPCLMSHTPIDLVIFMLGTNDLKERFNMNAHTIAQSMQQLVMQTRIYGMNASGAKPAVLIVSPPHIGENLRETSLYSNFGENSIAESRAFRQEFHKISRIQKAEFLDAAEFCQPSVRDAVHLTADGHRALAVAIADKIRIIFEK